jgi:hypothetical protein
MQDSRGGLKLEDVKGSGVPWSLAKSHRSDLNITGKPRGLFVKRHTFFLLWFRTEDTGGTGGSGDRRRRRPRPLGARRLWERKRIPRGSILRAHRRRRGSGAVGILPAAELGVPDGGWTRRQCSDDRFATGRSSLDASRRCATLGVNGLLREIASATNRDGGRCELWRRCSAAGSVPRRHAAQGQRKARGDPAQP